MLDTSARRHCWRLAWRTRRRRCGSTLLRARAWRHRRSSRGEAQLSTRSVAKGVRYELRQQNAGSSRRKAQPPHPNSLARSGAQRRATPRGEPQQTDEARGWRMKYIKGLGPYSPYICAFGLFTTPLVAKDTLRVLMREREPEADDAAQEAPAEALGAPDAEAQA